MVRSSRRRKQILICAAAVAAVASFALIGATNVRAKGNAPRQAAAAPANTTKPSLSGSATESSTLTVSNGTWSASPAITSYDYFWRRCDSSGGNCVDVAGVTTPTYRLLAADVGHTIVTVVQAKNADGSTNAASAPSPVVEPGPPTNITQPSISGTARQGDTISVSNGSWSSSTAITSYSYFWRRCDTRGRNCFDIRRATQQTYAVASRDVGHTLIGIVLARNAHGPTNAASEPSTVVGAAVPVNTALPVVTGTTTSGQTLTLTNGSWSSPVPIQSYGYSWRRCDTNGASCVDVAGATAPRYALTDADVSHTLVGIVQARNAAGTTNAVSRPSAVIGSGLPAGATREANGRVTVPAASIALPDRLTIDGVRFTPTIVRSLTTITASFHVTESHGYDVNGALVYAIGLPYSRVTTAPELRTGADGWAILQFQPVMYFPRQGYVTFFVRARKDGGSLLGGISTRRLVQIQIKR
jgi:hypothetical protein